MNDGSGVVRTRFSNITISGLPGAGSTVLGKELARRLNWQYYSGGDFMRKYAIEKGYFDPASTVHHDATVYPDDFDRQCDYGVREKLEKDSGCIYESWLSGFLSQQVKGTFKILVYCSDDAVRVDRIANRDDISIADAKVHIFDREKKNVEKWQKMYEEEWRDWVVKPGILTEDQPIFFWRPELYDLAIDTYKLGKEETLGLALEAITK